MAYASWMIVVIAGCSVAGWRLGQQRQVRQSTRAKRLFCLAGLTWIVAGFFSRWYADSSFPGWSIAAEYAHTGRYIFLAGLLCLGFFLALSSEADSVTASRKAIAMAVLLLGILVITYKSVPAWIFLDDGARDEDGYLKQTRDQEYTCAPVCLGNYLEIYKGDRPQRERQLAKACGTTKDGTTVRGLIKGSKAYGLHQANYGFITYQELVARPLPAVVMISTVPGMRHASMLVNIKTNQAHFIDPAYGEWSMTVEDFKDVWYGPTVYFE